MKQEDEGRFLARGASKIELTKTDDSFTAKLAQPSDAEALETEDGVQSVERLSRSLARVTIAPEADREGRRDTLMRKLREDRRMVVHHEYAAKDTPATSYQITDEIIVKFKPGTGREAMRDILEQAGVAIKQHYPKLGDCYLVEVTAAAGANPVKVANRLEGQEAIEYAEPCLVNRFTQMSFPADELFPAQWHLYSKNLTAPDIEPNADASVYEAWQITRGKREVVVAVLDDGFELSHPDFQGDNKVVHAVDFTGNDDNPLPGAGDYHGTPCAGVAIAEQNDLGCVGAAPGCAFMPVRFPLNASDAWLIEIFDYVSARAHVASCSWGMVPGNYPLHSAVNETFSQLAHDGGKDGKGLTIVFAAGNYDAPTDATVDYPIRWGGRDERGRWQVFEATGRIINGYGAHPDVITVSACTSLNRKSLYSNWGREISVAAPSSNFSPIDIAPLPGRGITTTDNEYYGEDFTPGKRYTSSFGGTSSATPLVAGVCALVKSANPALSAFDIRDILGQTADKIEDPAADPLYDHRKGGYENGHSEWFGYGRINAHRAVQEAQRRLGPQQTIERHNTEAMTIPDQLAQGIASVIDIAESAPLAALEVSVDITHSWIGDLEVALVSPAGTRVMLHDRAGSSADNIRRSYTPADTPGLAAFVNESARGRWTLSVADRARFDEGTLNSWSLRLTLVQDSIVRASTTESATIPDNDPRGIGSQLPVTGSGRVRDITVDVDITHSWIGDLRVSLVAPSGREVVLHDRSGHSADNIRTRYDTGNAPALAEFSQHEENIEGVWTLRVADLAQRDVGKLNRWGLEITPA